MVGTTNLQPCNTRILTIKAPPKSYARFTRPLPRCHLQLRCDSRRSSLFFKHRSSAPVSMQRAQYHTEQISHSRREKGQLVWTKHWKYEHGSVSHTSKVESESSRTLLKSGGTQWRFEQSPLICFVVSLISLISYGCFDGTVSQSLCCHHIALRTKKSFPLWDSMKPQNQPSEL